MEIWFQISTGNMCFVEGDIISFYNAWENIADGWVTGERDHEKPSLCDDQNFILEAVIE